MPNWCEGKLKVRGKKENIMKWLAECVAVWNPDVEKGKPLYDALVFKKDTNGVSLAYNDDELHVCICARCILCRLAEQKEESERTKENWTLWLSSARIVDTP